VDIDVVMRGSGPRQGTPLRAQSPRAPAVIRAAVREALREFETAGVAELPRPAILVAAHKP